MQKYTPPELNSSRPHEGEMGWNLHALRVIAVTFRALFVLRVCLKGFPGRPRAGTPWEKPIVKNELGEREKHQKTA